MWLLEVHSMKVQKVVRQLMVELAAKEAAAASQAPYLVLGRKLVVLKQELRALVCHLLNSTLDP